MIPKGSYQGIPILDGEFSHRSGFEAGRGWVTVLLSDLGGSLPKSKYLKQLKAFFNRSQARDVDKAGVQKSFDPNFNMGTHGVDTGTTTSTKPPPAGAQGLRGPYGDLVFELTDSQFGSDVSKPVTLKNIFWVEAVIEAVDAVDPSRAIVRIELADERIVWEMGGYVQGRYNMTLNKVHYGKNPDLSGNAIGQLLQWDPVTLKLTNTKEMNQALIDGDAFRPIMDPDTLIKIDSKTFRMWSLSTLILHIAQELPGPPELRIISSGVGKEVPLNNDWGAATPAKQALADIFKRYDLILAPSYENSVFYIYDRVQSARPGNKENISEESSIPEKYRSENYLEEKSISLQLEPLSVEVVGERIIEEIQCPCWTMVIKDTGFVEKSNGMLGREGQWVPVQTFCDNYGLDFTLLSRSVMANWDKDKSSIFEKVVPGKKDATGSYNEDDAKRKLIISALHSHLFKSYMVSGAYRKFLPMILKRAEGGSHALNMDNICLTRGARFFCDGWSPSIERNLTEAALFHNHAIEPLEASDIASIDEKEGVITFKEPMGSVVYSPSFAFIGASEESFENTIINTFKKDADKLALEIQSIVERTMYNVGREGRVFSDATSIIRDKMNKFMVANCKFFNEPFKKLRLNAKNIELISESLSPVKQEQVIGKYGRPGTKEAVNISECRLLEPRIIGIWSWERNYGRSDDFYRYRAGECPEASPFPIKVGGLTQFIAANGATNKKFLDTLAKAQAERYLLRKEEPIAGGQYHFVGFWPLVVCGTRPEVVFKISLQQPPTAETISVKNRFVHGIDGRAPSVSTWSGHQKPLPKMGQGE